MTRWWIASFSATAHTQEIGTRIWKEKKKLTIFSIILHENSLFALGGHTLFWLVYVPLYSPPEREENPALSLDELDVVWLHSNDGLTEWVNKLSFSVYKRKEKGGKSISQGLYISLSPSGLTFLFRIPLDIQKKKITPGGGPITEVFFKQHFTVSTISPINLFEHICLRWRDWHQRTFTFLFLKFIHYLFARFI